MCIFLPSIYRSHGRYYWEGPMRPCPYSWGCQGHHCLASNHRREVQRGRCWDDGPPGPVHPAVVPVHPAVVSLHLSWGPSLACPTRGTRMGNSNRQIICVLPSCHLSMWALWWQCSRVWTCLPLSPAPLQSDTFPNYGSTTQELWWDGNMAWGLRRRGHLVLREWWFFLDIASRKLTLKRASTTKLRLT